jgi:type VII secretion protein EccB
MRSRKDQVQAYFFVVGRLFSALTHGKPDILEPPSRRFSTGTVLGLLLAGLVVGIFAVIGLSSPGSNTQWKQPGAIIVTDETGARLVYLDGRLRPVLNFSSAKLAMGASSAGEVVHVSAASLSGTPVGPPIGIPGAPDQLPATSMLDRSPWTVCSSVTSPDWDVTLMLGFTAGSPVAQDTGMVVSGPDGSRYLLWQGHRSRLSDAAAITLGYSGVSAPQVAANWLNIVPPARDINVPELPDLGQPGPAIDGKTTIAGQILQAHNPALGGDQVFVVRHGGVTPISSTVEALLMAAPSTARAYSGQLVTPIEVSAAAFTGVPVVASDDLVGYPQLPPRVTPVQAGTQPCLRTDLDQGANTLLLVPDKLVSAASAAVRHVAGTTVDQVLIPAGTGVLASDLPTAGARPGTLYLITDFGVKYPLADDMTTSVLGYSSGAAVPVANRLLALLPTGPVLSPAAALAEQAPAA